MVEHAKAIRSLWTDLCRIETCTEYKKANGASAKRWDLLTEGEPCKLSFLGSVSQNSTPVPSSGAERVLQQVKLFIRPSLAVPAGSRITVTRGTLTLYYESSGIPMLYTDHQEILLEAKQKWV